MSIYLGKNKVNAKTPNFASGTKYIWTDIDGEGAWDVSGYQYCAVDGAPVKDYAHFRYWIRLTQDTGLTMSIGLMTSSGVPTIDWGDGSIYEGSWDRVYSHTYSDYGYYVITASPDIRYVDSDSLVLTPYDISSDSDNRTVMPVDALVYAELNGVHLQGAFHYETGGGNRYFYNGLNLKKAYFNGHNNPNNTQPYFMFNVVNKCTSLEEIILGENISGVGATIDISTLTGLRKIRFLSSTPPPTKSATAFTGLTTNCVISVPSGTLSAYTSAANYPDPATYTYIEE